MTPKAILFDLDGTLWDRNGAVRALATEQHRQLHQWLGHIPQRDYVERVVHLDDNGRADKNFLYQTIGIEFGLSEPAVAILHSDFWTRYQRFIVPFPEVIETLHHLRRLEIRLGIITNGSMRVQEAKISRLGMSDLMDVSFVGLDIHDHVGWVARGRHVESIGFDRIPSDSTRSVCRERRDPMNRGLFRVLGFKNT